MKKINTLLLVLLFSLKLFSQTTVTIGAGTNASTSFDYGNPIFRSSATSNANYSQSVQLLTAADLFTAGISNGGALLTKIGYNKTNEHTLFAGRTATLKIYLKNSNATNLVDTNTLANWTTGATLCYNNTSVSSTDIPASPGWVDFTLGTPFTYTGGAIEVVLDWSVNTGSGNTTTGSFLWQYSTNTTKLSVGTASNTPISGAISTSQFKKFNTKITYNNIVCTGTPAPGNTISSNITPCAGPSFSTTLSLQNNTIGSNITFQWFNSAGIISGATNATYNATISASTSFYCAVTCSGNTTNSNPIVLAPITGISVPVTENFENLLPTCWQNAKDGNLTSGPATFGSSLWTILDYGFTPVNKMAMARFINIRLMNDWLISTIYNIPATGYELKLDANTFEAGILIPDNIGLPTGYKLEVLASTSLSNWTVLYTYETSNTANLGNNTPNRINLDAFAGQNIRFALRAVKTTTNLGDIDFFIDNFQIRLQETCPIQTGIAVTNVTPNTASITWDDLSANGATGYEYAITNSSAIPTSSTSTTNFSISATGLTQAENHFIHVRPICGAGIFGDWSSAYFKTPCGNYTNFPSVEPFNLNDLNGECWERRSNGNLSTGPGAFDDSTGNYWVFTNFGNVNGNESLGVANYLPNMNEWILSPFYIIPNTNTYEVAFNTKVTESGDSIPPINTWDVGDGIQLLYSTNSTTWTVLHTFNAANMPTNNFAIQIPVTGNVRFAFRSVSGAVDGDDAIDFFADNFTVRLFNVCPYVSNLAITSFTHNSANISWNTAAGAVGYEYATTITATPPASGTATTATTITQTGLVDAFVNYIHVRANCGAGNFGSWETISILTPCFPVTEFEENYDTLYTNLTGGQYAGKCFYTVGDVSNGFVGDIFPKSSPYCLGMYGGGSLTNFTIETLQPVSNLGAGTHRFRFDMRSIDNLGDPIEFGYLTDLNDQNSFVPLTTFISNSSEYIAYQFLPPAGVYSNYIALRSTSGRGGVYIDNLVWDVKPTCPNPIITVSNVQTTSANLNWSTETPVNGFEYVINNSSLDPVIPGTATALTSFSASSLTPGTVYFFHVRSVCSGSFSEWATVSINTKPANDDCINAITLQNGATYNTYTTNVSRTGATAGSEPNPTSCSGYNGGDVWYNVIVPASGNITIETGDSTIGENGVDTVIIIYTGTCGSLTQIACDDDGAATARYSKRSLTGRTPGSNLLVRTYEYGNNNLGNFGIAAYDASLSTNSFEKENFKVYPNPFTNEINIENVNIGDTIQIYNILGQTVFSKVCDSEKVLNVSTISTKGIYFLKINNNAAIKIIKE